MPNWVTPEQLLRDSYIWERDHSLRVFPWDSLDNSDVLPPSRRIHITITGYPVDFWHPFYFRQATSSFGVMIGVSPESLRGENQSSFRLMVEVHDLKQVPYLLYVGHRGR